MDETLLVVYQRSRWNFFWYYVFAWLIFPLIIVSIKRRETKLRIHTDRVVLEEGLFSKDLKVIFISDIRTIDIRQTFIQRLLRIGDLLIATSGTSDYEDDVRGLPNPERIKDLIMQQRRGQSTKTPEKTEVTEHQKGRFKWLGHLDEEEID